MARTSVPLEPTFGKSRNIFVGISTYPEKSNGDKLSKIMTSIFNMGRTLFFIVLKFLSFRILLSLIYVIISGLYISIIPENQSVFTIFIIMSVAVTHRL